jgi:hypothetical protein
MPNYGAILSPIVNNLCTTRTNYAQFKVHHIIGTNWLFGPIGTIGHYWTRLCAIARCGFS